MIELSDVACSWCLGVTQYYWTSELDSHFSRVCDRCYLDMSKKMHPVFSSQNEDFKQELKWLSCSLKYHDAGAESLK